MSAVEIIGIVFVMLTGLAILWFWIAMIVHCVRNTPPRSQQRYAWLLIVVLGKLPGALVYYLVEHRGIRTLCPPNETASTPG